MRILFIILVVFLFNCSEQKKTREINLSNFKEFTLKDDHTSFNLIRCYPNNQCTKSIINSNVYVCALESGDTIYIFEPCKKVPDFARDDFKFKDDLDLIIMKERIQKGFAKNLFVPIEVQIDTSRRYLVGSITRLEY